MNIQSILLFQIIADVVLCIAILFLLIRIRKSVGGAYPPVHDEKSLLEFKKLFAESQEAADNFSRMLDEKTQILKDLVSDLEDKKRSLTALIQEAQRQLEKTEVIRGADHHLSTEKQYSHIVQLLKEGISIEEIARSTGLTAGEICLIADLENKKREVANR